MQFMKHSDPIGRLPQARLGRLGRRPQEAITLAVPLPATSCDSNAHVQCSGCGVATALLSTLRSSHRQSEAEHDHGDTRTSRPDRADRGTTGAVAGDDAESAGVATAGAGDVHFDR